MGSILLEEVMVIFGLSIIVLLICHRLHIPSIVGFLLTGVICGPFGLGLVKLNEDVQTLADLGVILLLFAVGMEFSIRKLLKHTQLFFVGGGFQVVATAFAGFAIAYLLGRPIGESIFLGFLLSLSSTAIVLRILDKHLETTTPHGKVTMSILIFQDIVAVPMMLMTPFLAGSAMNIETSFLYTLGVGTLLLIGVFIAALKLVPILMHLIARTKSRELFLLTTLCLCFSVAWVTASMGLSLSLGAFLAGLIVSETEYRNEAIEDIVPFQDVFTSFFFITIGMLLDIEFIYQNPILVLLTTLGVIALKATLGSIATFMVGMPIRTAIIVGLSIAQVGEFSFVLARSGMEAGLASAFHYQLFLAIAVLTMALTPSLMQLAPKLAYWTHNLPLPHKVLHGFHPIKSDDLVKMSDHVVIIGYGIPGQMLAHSCRVANIPFVVIELDPMKVKNERAKGVHIYYGDATHSSVLKQAGVEQAKAVVVLTNENAATMKVLDHTRKLNQGAYVVLRTRYVEEMKGLFNHGADEVIPDEFGSSVEIMTRVMKKYHIDSIMIDEIVQERRREGYELLRFNKEPTHLLEDKKVKAELGVESCKVPIQSRLVGKTLKQSALRDKYGVTVVLIKRGANNIVSLNPDTLIQADDMIMFVGSHADVKRVKEELFHCVPIQPASKTGFTAEP